MNYDQRSLIEVGTNFFWLRQEKENHMSCIRQENGIQYICMPLHENKANWII